jgi:hypothetical protein
MPRALLVARAGWGLACLAAPAVVGRALGLRPADRRAHLFLRLLGARDLGQAVLAGTAPPPALLRLGAGVDVLHALSMYALAAVSQDYRRPALTAAAVATTFAATTRPAARTRLTATRAARPAPARPAATPLPAGDDSAPPGRAQT